MKTQPSLFDYPLIFSRRNRYLLVGSPDFGVRVVAGNLLEPGGVTPETLGTAIVIAWQLIHGRIAELRRAGTPVPKPKSARKLYKEAL